MRIRHGSPAGEQMDKAAQCVLILILGIYLLNLVPWGSFSCFLILVSMLFPFIGTLRALSSALRFALYEWYGGLHSGVPLSVISVTPGFNISDIETFEDWLALLSPEQRKRHDRPEVRAAFFGYRRARASH